jgi:CRISPR-associated protein Cas1
MIEPFRGFVEAKVRDISGEIGAVEQLSQEIKGRLLEVLYEEVRIGEFAGPLMVGLHRTMASLQRCFAGEQKELDLPAV